jgi:hypothetical protein
MVEAGGFRYYLTRYGPLKNQCWGAPGPVHAAHRPEAGLKVIDPQIGLSGGVMPDRFPSAPKMMKIYLINFEESRRRRATDGRAADPASDRLCDRPSHQWPPSGVAEISSLCNMDNVSKYPEWLSPGAIGAALGHHLALSCLVEDNERCGLILEDDGANNLASILEQLESLYVDDELILLSGVQSNRNCLTFVQLRIATHCWGSSVDIRIVRFKCFYSTSVRVGMNATRWISFRCSPTILLETSMSQLDWICASGSLPSALSITVKSMQTGLQQCN